METSPRKRLGRPPKASVIAQRIEVVGSSQAELDPLAMSPQQLETTYDNVIEIDGSAVALSPMPDDVISPNTSVTAASECRRSSRKKIVKFDVRDLLNKNRKPHKIQIEARIDSNAPTTSMAGAHCAASTSTSAAGMQATADLTRKQKTFIEKSAIFRRYSISEQQGKLAGGLGASLLPAVAMLGTETGLEDGHHVAPPIDAAKMAQARRLSRAQEIFNATMMRSKLNTSLIIAQMESNSTSGPTYGPRRAPVAQVKKPVVGSMRKNALPKVPKTPPMYQSTVVVAQKRRGRPPKKRIDALTLSPNNDEAKVSLNFAGSSHADVAFSPRSVTDGMCQQNVQASGSKASPERSVKIALMMETNNVPSQQVPKTITKPKCEIKILTPETATNWQEYKASQMQASAISSGNADTAITTAIPVSKQSTYVMDIPDIILEISSSSSEEHDAMQPSCSYSDEVTHVGEGRQRNFAAVSFLQEGTTADNNLAAPEFIVAAVEEIIAENETFDSSSNVESASTDCIVLTAAMTSNEATTAPISPKKLTPESPSSGTESETASSELNNKLRLSLPNDRTKSPSGSSTDFATSYDEIYETRTATHISKYFQNESLEINVNSAKLSEKVPEYSKNCTEKTDDVLITSFINVIGETQRTEEQKLDDFRESSQYMIEEMNKVKKGNDVVVEFRNAEEHKMFTVDPIHEMAESSVEKSREVDNGILLAAQQDVSESDTEKKMVKHHEVFLASSKEEVVGALEKVMENDNEVMSTCGKDWVEPTKNIATTKLQVNVVESPDNKGLQVDILPQHEPSDLLAEMQVQALSLSTAETTKSPVPELGREEPIFMEHDYLKSDAVVVPKLTPGANWKLANDLYASEEVTETCPQLEPLSIGKVEAGETSELPQASKVTITLPPKKQAGKFHYLESLADVVASAETMPVAGGLNEEARVFTETSIQNVSVETSTLLDILRTVRSNKVSQSSAGVGGIRIVSPTTDEVVASGSADVHERAEAQRRSENRCYGAAVDPNESIINCTLEETFSEITAKNTKEVLRDTVYNDKEMASMFSASDRKSVSEDEGDRAPSVDLSKVDDFTLDVTYRENITNISFHDDIQVANEVEIEGGALIDNEVPQIDSQAVADLYIDEGGSGETVAKDAQVSVNSCQTFIDSNFENSEKAEKNKAVIETTSPVRRGRKPKQRLINVAKMTEIQESDQFVKQAADISLALPGKMTAEDATNNSEEISKNQNTEAMGEHLMTKIIVEDKATVTPSSEVVHAKVTGGTQPVVKDVTPMPPKKRLWNYHLEVEHAEQLAKEKTPSPEKASGVARNEEASLSKQVTSSPLDKIKPDKDTTRSTSKSKKTRQTKSAQKTEATKQGKYSDSNDSTGTGPTTSIGKRGKQKLASDAEVVAGMSSATKTKTTKGRQRNAGKATTNRFAIKLPIGPTMPTSLSPTKSCDGKSDKNKRQKKPKTAMEAVLKDDVVRSKRDLASQANDLDQERDIAPADSYHQIPNHPTKPLESNITTTLALPLPVDTIGDEIKSKAAIACSKQETTEPRGGLSDPLLDIEKFIEAGVNLLKRPYKHEDDEEGQADAAAADVNTESDPAIVLGCAKTENAASHPIPSERNIVDSNLLPTNVDTVELTANTKDQLHLNYETPADTPLTTPIPSPPPAMSESQTPSHPSRFEHIADILPDELSGVRRSHRLKLATKAAKALVGRGLVRDKERLSLKDDIETKSHYTIDDQLTDLAEVDAKNAKFLKDMEERLSNFQVIKENDYKCERLISREARKMTCDCFLTFEEEERGELGCGEDCLNRLLMIECGPDCHVKDRCTNKRFQKYLCSPCRVFRTEKKGFGIMADIEILPGEFIMEYVGEVIDGEQFDIRRNLYSLDKNRHYYFMALRSDAIIDATIKGNISRFINHSCDPNAETQKWTVNGELRIGFFSRKSIKPGEEITFDYQYQRYGREAQRCFCESSNCRGWIGEEPNSDEGEQMDDEEDSDVGNLAECLLRDAENESDGSEVDPAEVQKKLEQAAAAAQLAPYSADDNKNGDDDDTRGDKKKASVADLEDGDSDPNEDSNSRFKKLLSKLAQKVAKKRKRNVTKQKSKWPADSFSPGKSRYREDPNFDSMVHFLSCCGLKTQSDTLLLSRLMVIAKDPETRLTLLAVLRDGELPCRRLFLDYHGLRLLHGWMSESGDDVNIRLSLLQTLECLPIANKTVLTDSKVYESVRNWCGATPLPAAGSSTTSPTDESSKESGESSAASRPAINDEAKDAATVNLKNLALKLATVWDSLPEIFRIPKRERIEQMKEHEREADLQYAAASKINVDGEEANKPLSTSDRYQRDRFGRASRFAKPQNNSKETRSIVVVGSGAVPDVRKRSTLEPAGPMALDESTKHLSKEERRQLFAAKVERHEAEKRMAVQRKEYDSKCRFFGLDPKKTQPQDIPFCVDPATGQWYSAARDPVPTPPTYSQFHIHVKMQSMDPANYHLPDSVAQLPPEWEFAISPQGKLYYYHVQQRLPQWEAPTEDQIKNTEVVIEASESDSESELEYEDSSDADEDEKECEKSDELEMDAITGEKDDSKEKDAKNDTNIKDAELAVMDEEQLKALIEKKIRRRRKLRYKRLVDERPISPRREEDRIYNQMEVRRYKENKEKIRKRKEEIRRRRVEALKNDTMTVVAGVEGAEKTCDTGEPNSNAHHDAAINAPTDALPIQDFLISSDEEEVVATIKMECDNSPLQGDQIVDEIDALKTGRVLKRPFLSHRDIKQEPLDSSGSSSTGTIDSDVTSVSTSSAERTEHKRRRLEKKEKIKKNKDADSKYRKLKEKFRCEIAGIIVHHLKPYRQDSCSMSRICSDNDFNHLARKLTHFVMIKELKYCESVGQTLVVTESVKNKSREFIKKYMSKYDDVYVKPESDPEFKDIPFAL